MNLLYNVMQGEEKMVRQAKLGRANRMKGSCTATKTTAIVPQDMRSHTPQKHLGIISKLQTTKAVLPKKLIVLS